MRIHRAFDVELSARDREVRASPGEIDRSIERRSRRGRSDCEARCAEARICEHAIGRIHEHISDWRDVADGGIESDLAQIGLKRERAVAVHGAGKKDVAHAMRDGARIRSEQVHCVIERNAAGLCAAHGAAHPDLGSRRRGICKLQQRVTNRGDLRRRTVSIEANAVERAGGRFQVGTHYGEVMR
jgi:hypothetical protein